MVNTITGHTINDGERNLVVKTHIVGDGSGEETDTILINASAFVNAPTDMKIKAIWASLRGFSMDLIWDATTDVDILTIPAEDSFDKDYRRFGGIPNNSGTGKTGDVLFTSTGLGAGDEGTIILHMQKS